MSLDRQAKVCSRLSRIAAGDRTAQRKLCDATLSPLARPSKQFQVFRGCRHWRAQQVATRLGRSGCGRLPYRHDVGFASHRLREVCANPLPLRPLPPAHRIEFINEFRGSAAKPQPVRWYSQMLAGNKKTRQRAHARHAVRQRETIGRFERASDAETTNVLAMMVRVSYQG